MSDKPENKNATEAFEKSLDVKRVYVLKLFVSGMTPNSLRAIRNVREICRNQLEGGYELEVVDIYQPLETGKGKRIIAAPMLLRKLPKPSRRFVGDLSDTEKILAGLGLIPNKDEKRLTKMTKTTIRDNVSPDDIERLQGRLREAEELIDAIRNGGIDALLVTGPDESSVYTLKGADHTYRILIETMDEGAVVLSKGGTILYCNKRFAKMVRVPFNRAMGTSIADFLGPRDREMLRVLYSRVFGKECAKAEIALKSGDGEPIPALVSLCTLCVDDLEALCMVVTDLTEQKKSEETLKSYSKRLYRKNAELKKRAEQLARLSSELTMTEQRERKRMARILHDGLQQMLASAKLQVGCMQDKLDRRDQKRALVAIEAILADSIGIARSLCMDLSPPVLYEGGLAAGLEWLANSMREKHDFNVELSIEACPEPADDIKVLVFESVRELLFNAVKHSKANLAKVSLRQENGVWIRIVVSDEGAGFDIARFQEPENCGGGFGLFSIRERIGLLGGGLHIESAPGMGSRFTLTVPRIGTPSVAFGGKTENADDGLADLDDNACRSATRVLLADDHTLFRDGIARILNRESDIEVAGHARNGREAMELALKLKPHVILMDIGMPDVGGIEATAAIHREIPEIRIIGLSMYEDLENARSMYQAGACDYKNKACPVAELLSAIRA